MPATRTDRADRTTSRAASRAASRATGKAPGRRAARVPRRRQVLAGSFAAGLLAVTLAGCGGAATAEPEQRGEAGHAAQQVRPLPAAEATTLSQLPAKLAADGTTIVVGDPDAKHTVRIYADFRCPYCEKFETATGELLAEAAAKGEVKLEYTLASFLDGKLGGAGSAKAVNAARAALDAGRFPEFHAALFANQPGEESTDAFTDAFLLRIASGVPGLRSDTFDQAVEGMTHRAWVTAAEQAFEQSGVRSTPTVLVDGEQITDGSRYDRAAFAKVLEAAGIAA
ncbi:disulfide bond formation protein D [Kitasatospora sp. MMS16-BH015]|uniref:DsbA family protein n=1 Tax=Kitasatospora sp. MMS16-BH015 TaxID=2018025 RepID=UPI000CA34545|nr:thioredoxin domain-containing protein [Kitasatospora sp. MMS16-BH015]AUG79485.1 disulfide bond formation protein D [Kitasatospora sp. MMS16-BH015]